MRDVRATFNRAGLTVRLNIEPAGSTSRWGLTLDEARSVIRELNKAVFEGDEYVAELRAAASVKAGIVNARTGEGHP